MKKWAWPVIVVIAFAAGWGLGRVRGLTDTAGMEEYLKNAGYADDEIANAVEQVSQARN